ncbi:MAG: hypothetical protein MJ123_08820 [Lachnospiraceae bacterium]|nr:hypothetical protein [Lachnospiraceae bacterium]
MGKDLKIDGQLNFLEMMGAFTDDSGATVSVTKPRTEIKGRKSKGSSIEVSEGGKIEDENRQLSFSLDIMDADGSLSSPVESGIIVKELEKIEITEKNSDNQTYFEIKEPRIIEAKRKNTTEPSPAEKSVAPKPESAIVEKPVESKPEPTPVEEPAAVAPKEQPIPLKEPVAPKPESATVEKPVESKPEPTPVEEPKAVAQKEQPTPAKKPVAPKPESATVEKLVESKPVPTSVEEPKPIQKPKKPVAPAKVAKSGGRVELFERCSECWCSDCKHNSRNEGKPREMCGTMMPCPACETCIEEGHAEICEIGSYKEGCRTRAIEEGIFVEEESI